MWNAITDVPGIAVGHWTDLLAATGCTVVLCEDGAIAGVDVRGSAPGTRETDLLRPLNLVRQVHAVVLAGGSAFGLDAAGGVMRYLEERGEGFRVRRWRVPIVAGAVLMDLMVGDGTVRPGQDEGYQACVNASRGPVPMGSVGAGTGATLGKVLGRKGIVKGGIGSASQRLGDGTVVGAIVALNAFGEIVDSATGATVAGPRKADGTGFASTMERLRSGRGPRPVSGESTTIGVVAASAALTKEGANKVAQMAQDGLAQAIRPAHTMGDGDVLFAMATGRGADGKPLRGRRQADVTAIGAVAADVVARAIVAAAREAESLAGVPAVRDLGYEN
ncbi:MAG: P1 family peptidase [Dehalococcoidia bacterium]